MWNHRLTSALVRSALAAAALVIGAAAAAQTWPRRPITWIVPFAAGGPTDALARDFSDHIGKQLRQTIIIENAPGAGGTIGSGKAAKAPPDGYTFLVGHMGYMGAGPALYNKLPYEPTKDFEAVFRLPDTPLVLLVPKSSPFKTVEQLIAAAKAKPGSINFGNAGTGSSSHLIAALFEARAGIDIMQVPYKGAAPAMNDLIAGQVDAMFDQSSTALPQVRGGRVRAIALTSSATMPQQFPGVPTLSSAALPGFDAVTWYGLYAPKGTPKEVTSKLQAAFLKSLSDKDWLRRMEEQGIRFLPEDQYTGSALAQHTAAEVARWRKVKAEANIQVD